MKPIQVSRPVWYLLRLIDDLVKMRVSLVFGAGLILAAVVGKLLYLSLSNQLEQLQLQAYRQNLVWPVLEHPLRESRELEPHRARLYLPDNGIIRESAESKDH